VLPKDGLWKKFLDDHPTLRAWVTRHLEQRLAEKRLKKGFELENPDEIFAGGVSVMATFRRWAPWLPPKINRVNFASGPPSRGLPSGRNFLLIGFPVRMDFCAGKCRSDAAKEMKARSTTRPRIRLLSPGNAFCSWMAVRYPMAQAAKTTGPEA